LKIPYVIEKKIISLYNPAGIILVIENSREQHDDPRRRALITGLTTQSDSLCSG
jgi:hypothetical protein